MATVNAIYGLFPGPRSADRGMESLRQAGVDSAKLLVISSEPFEGYSFSEHRPHGIGLQWIAFLGAVIGFANGIFMGWFTQAAYPINTAGMPIITLWPIAIITYELTLLFAIIATLVGLAFGARLPNFKRQVYDPEVSDGKVLIGVLDPPEASRSDLENRLRRAGAQKVKTAVI